MIELIEENNSKRCIICGARTRRSSQIYCEKHRAEGREKDRQILEKATLEQFFPLIVAIFNRARADYLYNADGKREDAKKFYHSMWAQELSLSHFDPDMVIEQMDEEIVNGFERFAVYPSVEKWG